MTQIDVTKQVITQLQRISVSLQKTIDGNAELSDEARQALVAEFFPHNTQHNYTNQDILNQVESRLWLLKQAHPVL